MSFLGMFLVALGLSMDAFAVAVCKGLSLRESSVKSAVVVGLYFGGFQALMPGIGYLVGTGFSDVIAVYGHWVAFGLLTVVGAGMLRGALGEEEDSCDGSLRVADMVVLAVATSIDALAVGVGFAFLQVNILSAMFLIGIVAFFLSALGVYAGSLLGNRYQARAQILGGILLIGMGVRILMA